MPERITIVVRPDDQGNLTVEDAMRQVLNQFELLDRLASRKIEWRLVEAKTNSPPFSVTAEADDEAAAEQAAEYATALSEISQGEMPEAWNDPVSRKTVEWMLKRVARGAFLEVRASVAPVPIQIAAQQAIVALDAAARAATNPPRTKDQIGSIEGELLDASADYGKPALTIRERKTGEKITCVLSDELAKEFDELHSFFTVWLHHRVVVRGLIRYNKWGRILRVVATDADLVQERDVPIDAIRDPHFTGDLSSDEFLDQARGEDLGQAD